MDDLIEALITKHISSVETAETRHSDRLDFHDVHIGSLVALVRNAVARGMEMGMDAMSKNY